MGVSKLPAAPIFPVGLFTFVLTEQQGIKFFMAGSFGVFPSLVGWVIYALLFICMWRTKRERTLFLLYAVFCVLLVLNIAGCNNLLKSAAEIH